MTNTHPIFAMGQVLPATPQQLWKAFTVAEELQQWFAPQGVTMPRAKMDLRVGGTFWYEIKFPSGGAYGLWSFQEISEPNRLVVLFSSADAMGKVTPHPMRQNFPLYICAIFTFTPISPTETKMETAMSPYQAEEAEINMFRDGLAHMKPSWQATLDQLVAYLKK